MNRKIAVYAACFALLLLSASSPVRASESNHGFAAYEVRATPPTGQHSVLINESLHQAAKAGFSILMLRLTGGVQNLTYTKLVNATTNLLPFVPSLPTQSFDYSNGTRYRIHVNFSSGGTDGVTFQGSHYALNVFSISVIGFYGNKSASAQGTVKTFPSGLVYFANASASGKLSVQAQLQSTNLPLLEPSPQTATAAYVGAGIGVGGIALAAALLARRRDRKAATQERKPMHWVD